ncbi:MAG: hypothetical protein PWP18_396 [Thermoanaerobacter sp.]|jgi:hypothetical protein|nr:hypothetical protein [Thermoanaerobacter sp.]
MLWTKETLIQRKPKISSQKQRIQNILQLLFKAREFLLEKKTSINCDFSKVHEGLDLHL